MIGEKNTASIYYLIHKYTLSIFRYFLDNENEIDCSFKEEYSNYSFKIIKNKNGSIDYIIDCYFLINPVDDDDHICIRINKVDDIEQKFTFEIDGMIRGRKMIFNNNQCQIDTDSYYSAILYIKPYSVLASIACKRINKIQETNSMKNYY